MSDVGGAAREMGLEEWCSRLHKDHQVNVQLRELQARAVQSEIAPLTPAMDNVLAWRLGEIANAAVKESAGDLIDRGLGLLKHLNEREFQVIYTGKKPL